MFSTCFCFDLFFFFPQNFLLESPGIPEFYPDIRRISYMAQSSHCPSMKQKLLLTSFAEAEAQTLWVFWLPVSVCLSPHPYRANGCLFSFGASVFWGLLADLRSLRLDKALRLGRRPVRLVLSASFTEVCSTVFSCSSFCCFSWSSLSFSKEKKLSYALSSQWQHIDVQFAQPLLLHH